MQMAAHLRPPLRIRNTFARNDAGVGEGKSVHDRIDVFGQMLPFHRINGPAGRELGIGATAAPKLLPAPDYPVGIIAGDSIQFSVPS